MAAARPDADIAPLREAGVTRLPPEPGGGPDPAPDTGAAARSLMADLEALIDDGKVYLEAEANYQKTRAVYVADRVRAAAFFGAIGGAFGFIALIGLTVGAILTLDQWMPTSLASALVVGVEALLSFYFLRRASLRWTKIMEALGLDEKRVDK